MVNAERHGANPMPPKATLEQRIKWHLEHHRECGCREIPAKIAAEVKKRRLE